MDTVYTTLFNTVSTFLLTEARRIAGQGIRKLLFRNDLVNEFTDHGMLTGSDQIQILALDLIHHGIHLSKTHNAGNNVTSDHEWRYTVGKSTIDHEISCIRDNCRVKSCNITHQIVETISSHSTCAVKIDSIKTLHDLCVIRDLKIRNNRLAVFSHFYIFRIIFTNRNTRINDIRNYHHDLGYFLIQLFFFYRKLFQTGSVFSYFFLNVLCLIFFTLRHQRTDLFRNFIFLSAKCICFLLSCSSLCIQFNYFVYQR